MKRLKVKSVKRLGKQTVYDMSVADHHSYITDNGLINHNTTAKDIKRMFVAPPGKLIVQVDYSQAELRVMATMANETSMIEWFNSGRDIHLSSACKKYHEDYDEIIKIYNDEDHPEFVKWKKRRKQAKTLNFGIMYGQGAKHLSESLSTDDEKVTKEQAQEFLDEFFEDFPRVKKFVKKQHRFVHTHGYVTNIFGTKRRLPDIWDKQKYKVAGAERDSVNSPIQGGASNFTQLSSIMVNEAIEKGELPNTIEYINTIHDSLIYYIDVKDLHTVIPKMIEICSYPDTEKWFGFKFDKVDMKVDAEVGWNWSILKNYNPEVDYVKYEKERL